MAVGAYLIGVLRSYPDIDAHEEIMHDAEYEKE